MNVKIKFLFKIIIFIGFVYQLFDLIKKYLSFNHTISVNINIIYGIITSFTVCVNKKDIFQERFTKNINASVYSEIYNKLKSEFINYEETNNGYYIRYKNK